MPDQDLELGLLANYLQYVFQASYKRLIERLDRWTLMAAPLNPTSYPKGNTQTLNRWDLPQNLYSYLYVPQDVCNAVRHKLMAQIVFMPSDQPPPSFLDQLRQQLINQYEGIEQGTFCPLTREEITVADIKAALTQTSRIGSLELNLDFAPNSDASNGPEFARLSWINPPYYLYQLRSLFAQQGGLLSKIQTKAYLTDRRQTGTYPSNREARWEIHRRSPQFATHMECIHVETKLLAQILEFSGAPQISFEEDIRAQIESVIRTTLRPGNFRCPISGQFIKYDDFVRTAQEPQHGRSPYQVAHIIPLAYTGGRHVAQNTSWITELGNRVQGEDALDEIVDKIFMMAQYHKERLDLTWEDVENRVRQADQVKEAQL